MNKFYSLILFLIALKCYSKILLFLKDRLNSYHKKEWYKYAFLSRKHLVQLSIGDFEDWCCYFLERQDYSDVSIVSTWNDNKYKTITCKKDNTEVYVWCKLTSEVEEISDSYGTVGRPDLQKFIGTIEHDNITQGIVITTGDFTSEALDYVKNLPERFSITLYDGIALSKYHRKIREKEVAMLLQQNI
ncbi:restriction endonuclease [Clostridium sp. CX1]|uniref:restriction endonuclease n=1 Tax=Clostridium sp. CX1 TaxID=2978346 RepID=UPI0021BF56DE|nr:restriction endonuclease [Clostridium sp. CX1]MCT8976282.1 restriction endonuclease [Clostridium sp. CX1]